MPHKKRKVRKQRGSRTYGYGRVGQHRGGGQRGGRGKAGFHKHKWTYTLKYERERISKHGFNSFIKNEDTAVNIGKLDEQIETLLDNQQAEKTKEGIKVYLNKLGYDKLLGKGKVTHKLIIEVDSCTKLASEKIEKAGGKILAS